jgi:hypothetical protein
VYRTTHLISPLSLSLNYLTFQIISTFSNNDSASQTPLPSLFLYSPFLHLFASFLIFLIFHFFVFFSLTTCSNAPPYLERNIRYTFLTVLQCRTKMSICFVGSAV